MKGVKISKGKTIRSKDNKKTIKKMKRIMKRKPKKTKKKPKRKPKRSGNNRIQVEAKSETISNLSQLDQSAYEDALNDSSEEADEEPVESTEAVESNTELEVTDN